VDKETAAKEYEKIKNEFDMITPGYSLEKFSKFFDWLSDYISIDLRVGEESAKKICGGIRLSPDYTEKTIEEETEKLKQNPYMDIIFKMLGNPEVFAVQNAEGLKKVLNDPNL
ncbi:MAG: hypothetical protein HUJ86_04750, partial [Synergistes sp.]|nr:hypothetical protein [Synergistes sp.]